MVWDEGAEVLRLALGFVVVVVAMYVEMLSFCADSNTIRISRAKGVVSASSPPSSRTIPQSMLMLDSCHWVICWNSDVHPLLKCSRM